MKLAREALLYWRQPARETIRKYADILGRFLVAFAVVFLIVRFVQHFDEMPSLVWSAQGLLCVGVGVAYSAATVLMIAYAWAILLRGGNVMLPLKQAYIIMGRAQIGKYLPGNIFQYVGRISLSYKIGVSAESALLSIGVETALLVSTATLLAACGLFLDPVRWSWIVSEWPAQGFGMTLWMIALFAAVLVIMLVLSPTRTWIYPRLAYLRIERIGKCLLLYAGMFVGYGWLISLLLRGLWEVDIHVQWWNFVWGFALAWVVGFVVPGAPGGVGIREVVLVGLYGRELGEGLVTGLAFVLRAVTSLGDLVAFGIAYYLSKHGVEEVWKDKNTDLPAKGD